ncbi:MAG: phosphotyrosine protein phosphatase [Akkermansiaceae bacterium]|nr:phosphotyrosine protein phosphatase [Akkermansiaceae bacterium]
MRVLFLCSKNRLRSPTAEHIFTEAPDLETDSAGLNRDADVRLSDEQIEWADLIVAMESSHRAKLTRDYSSALRGKRVVVLGIPDNYDFMSDDLIALLKQKCAPFF